jgi:type II secretory pathway component PulF
VADEVVTDVLHPSRIEYDYHRSRRAAMPTFQFKAIDAAGGVVIDAVDAVNEVEARQKIRQMDYSVIFLIAEIKPARQASRSAGAILDRILRMGKKKGPRDGPKKKRAECHEQQGAWSWRSLFSWPIGRSSQALFAQAFAEALDVGIEVTTAIALAAEVNPGSRLRRVLAEMRLHTRSGYGLAAALAKTRARVKPQLLAALEVGEEHGSLVEELFAFAHGLCPDAAQLLRQTVGRRAEATRFAAALARLLREHGLTVQTVMAAGNLAAAGNNDFRQVIQALVEDMESGGNFTDALRQHPSYFDPLYCGFLEAADSRQQVRACLERLG